MTALVPTRADRPVTLTVDNWVVYVSVHDAEYERQKRSFKALLRVAHPDMGGSDGAFQLVHGRYKRWQQSECEWYARLGLLPPDNFKGRNVEVAVAGSETGNGHQKLLGVWRQRHPKTRKRKDK